MAERYAGHQNFYTRNTLMGNWFEDKLKAEIEEKEREQKQGIRNKELIQYKAKLNVALKKVELTDCTKQPLKYGDIIMLQNDFTSGVLSTDADEAEKIWRNDAKVLQSTTSSVPKYTLTSFARNSFMIEAPSNKTNEEGYKMGDTLHYDQPFCLSIHSQLSSTPHYLHSEIVSHLSSADFSRDQMVVFHPKKSSATRWKFQIADHSQRIEYNTLPIILHENNNVVIQHCNTCSLLASDKIAVGTDFGNEYQTSCNTFNPKKRIQTIKKEIIGFGTESRGELPQNKWSILDSKLLSDKKASKLQIAEK